MGLASAQTKSVVVDLFLVGFDNSTDYVASIIASDATATTYSVTCASVASAAATTASDYGYDSGECELPDSFTFTQGPSTMHYVMAYNEPYTSSGVAFPDAETIDVGCVLTSSTIGVCSDTDNGAAASTTFSMATTISFANGADEGTILTAIPVTITAGGAVTGNTASPTGSASSGAASDSSSKKGSTATSSSSTASGTASSKVSGAGGMPMVTAKAQWIVGGAAAALALAAL